eukprot:GHVS01001593.1.p1 GENE.GHVS01001593.1~~GHVS01001593.1.p1  ORF type:complete len:381 (+),score=46.05 GHVS01001593.1:3-1145(+)
MLLAVLLSFVVCPKFGLVDIGNMDYRYQPLDNEDPVQQVTPVTTPRVMLPFHNYPARSFATDLFFLAYFMDMSPPPACGDNFTLSPEKSWNIPPVGEHEPVRQSLPSALNQLSEKKSSGKTFRMSMAKSRDSGKVPLAGGEGTAKKAQNLMSDKYLGLFNLEKFDFRQKHAASDNDLDAACSEFLTNIGWRTPTKADEDYCYFIADYLLEKVAKHFEWITNQQLLYSDHKVLLDAAMAEALQELDSQKQSYITPADRQNFDALKKQSKKFIRNGKVAKLRLDGTKVNVLWAEMKVDNYGTRQDKTIREVLKKSNADFCVLWRKNDDASVTLHVPEQFENSTDNLRNHLTEVAATRGTFDMGELTVHEHEWENIKKALKKP